MKKIDELSMLISKLYGVCTSESCTEEERAARMAELMELLKLKDERRSKNRELIVKAVGIGVEILVGVAIPVTLQILRDRSYDRMATKYMLYDSDGHIVSNPAFKSFTNSVKP